MGYLFNMLNSFFMQFVQFSLRVFMMLWPIWLALILRSYVGSLVPDYPWHIPAMTFSILVLSLVIITLGIFGFLPPLSMKASMVLLILSGAYTLYNEYNRLEPYLMYYSKTDLIQYIDKYAVISAVVVIITPLIFLLKLAGFDFPKSSQKSNDFERSSKSTYGSADWFDLKEAKKKLEAGDIVIAEAYSHHPKIGIPGKEQKLRVKAKGHLLTISGSGGGKSTTVVIPNMLEWKHSAICIDPKTEIEQFTGFYRKSLGQKVIRLNADLESTDGFNVLDWIDITKDKAIMDAQSVVEWLSETSAKDSGSSNSKFFERAARSLIEVVLLDVLFNPELDDNDKTLLTVREALGQPDMIDYIKSIRDKGQNYAFGAPANKASMLLPMLEKGESTMASILGTADNMTEFLIVPSLSRLVCGNSFKTAELIEGNITIFVQIPLKTLDSTPAIARLIIGALLNRIYEAKGNMQENVLVMLDEMPRLGYMKLLETARDAGRSFGITLWGICQSTGQLEKIYGREGMRDWMESCFVRTFFGIQGEVTAEMISKEVGTATVKTHTVGSSESGSRKAQDVLSQVSSNKSDNFGETGRRLITLDEVIQMEVDEDGNPDEQIVFIRNHKPLRVGVLKYYRREDYLNKTEIIC